MNRDQFIQRIIPQSIIESAAYQVVDSTGMIKLDAMENPYSWPDSLRSSLANRLAACELNRYPDPSARAVRTSIKSWMKIPNALSVLFGNGSDEIIALLISSLIGSGRSVCAPDPSFVMFKVLAKQFRVPFHALPLDEEMDLDTGQWIEGLNSNDAGIVFVPQPNNPTGNLFTDDRLRAVVESTDALVVIDEAYTAFTDADYIDWAEKYPNVLIMRTLSKIGLAGSRFGLLIGAPEWISEYDKLRLPYNINTLSQAAVVFALEHSEILEEQSAAIRSERQRLTLELGHRNVKVWPSEANFILVEMPKGRAFEIFEGLKSVNILVKCLDGVHPALADTLRITVGIPCESDAMLMVLDQLLDIGR